MELIVYKKSFVRNATIGLDIYVILFLFFWLIYISNQQLFHYSTEIVSKRVPKGQGQCTII